MAHIIETYKHISIEVFKISAKTRVLAPLSLSSLFLDLIQRSNRLSIKVIAAFNVLYSFVKAHLVPVRV